MDEGKAVLCREPVRFRHKTLCLAAGNLTNTVNNLNIPQISFSKANKWEQGRDQLFPKFRKLESFQTFLIFFLSNFFYKNWNIGNILSPKNWKIILETFQFTKFGKRKWMKPSMTLTRAMSQLKALQVSEKSSDRLKRSPNIPPKTYSIILMIPINTLTYFWYISWPLSKP